MRRMPLASSPTHHPAMNPASNTRTRLMALRGNLLGALTAASVSLPVEATYGMIAVAPLGPDYMALGVLGALYCAILSNLTGLLTGSRPGLLGGTRPTLVLALAVLIGNLAERWHTPAGPDVPLILAFTMLTIFMAGVFQVAMSIGHIGRILKYLPFPVLAGFINGASLLVLLSALRPFIGLPNAANLEGFLHDLAAAPLEATALYGALFAVVAGHCYRHDFASPAGYVPRTPGAQRHFSCRGAENPGPRYPARLLSDLPRSRPAFDLRHARPRRQRIQGPGRRLEPVHS